MKGRKRKKKHDKPFFMDLPQKTVIRISLKQEVVITHREERKVSRKKERKKEFAKTTDILWSQVLYFIHLSSNVKSNLNLHFIGGKTVLNR